MLRTTAADRDEQKKREKEQKRQKDDVEEIDRSTWCKYTMGLKHQVSYPLYISSFIFNKGVANCNCH